MGLFRKLKKLTDLREENLQRIHDRRQVRQEVPAQNPEHDVLPRSFFIAVD
jgi:hypothetical protein